MKIGLDVGSTTIKSIVLDNAGSILYSAYERHFSQITAKTVETLKKIRDRFREEDEVSLVISGSAGMGMAESCSVDFVQEVQNLVPFQHALVRAQRQTPSILYHLI